MKFLADLFRLLSAVLLGLTLAGCLENGTSRTDEEREPHFLAGKRRTKDMDFQGAKESFEKALEVNPQNSAAHFELAMLEEQRLGDPAAGIYHYQRYLALRGEKAEKKDLIKERIFACKQELARTVSLGNLTAKQQSDLERVIEENRLLKLTNQALNAVIVQMRLQSASQSSTAVNPGPAGPVPANTQSLPGPRTPSAPAPAPSTFSVSTNLPAASSPSTSPGLRQHVVKSGETPAMIARQYGVKLSSLMTANPRLEAKRMRAGQTIYIPDK
jgi:LysM repeat protein